ncbi:MAG TPA: HslU--HslV peptidase ATPase subunit [Cytophagales bacterium]|jgi:ATP-dependent HslUV protease ATP-binding subunit HslU|nr:HslU--HslV peptidase ATPase subunit [Cytophagales bacterium]
MVEKIAQHLTPQEIVAELDKYIIGQHEAKKNVAIALRNRWRRMNAAEDMRKEIVPNNILMIGATGVGKTEIARRLAKLADAPFTKVEASKFTEVGYVGRDVESMVRDLTMQAVNMVKKKKKEEVKEKALLIIEDIILESLIPPIKQPAKQSAITFGMSNEQNEEDVELNNKTRERFREKLRNGELEQRKIEINVPQSPSANVGVIGPSPMDESSMMNIQEMISGMLPQNKRKRKVTIEEARKILLEEESTKLIDMDEVKEEAVWKTENLGIIFIDEIDKIARSNKAGGGADVSREGVQRDLLPIVEGSSVNTKYGVVNTDHILFIAAGAFHFSKPSDLIPELQGRFPIRVELEKLTKENFYQILKTPKNSLTKQYESLFETEGVKLEFEDEALHEMAEIAFNVNAEIENIGARRLQTVVSQLLNEFLYQIPENRPEGDKITVTKTMVQERLGGLVKDKDLSRYIL